ncbi:MAG TPA: UDP-N-acetylmuramoyl-L-alanyl-D-glutamate--2,6-diaminopimelate ligase [Solirubrobacteraceae bacterium]|jgi:UDP-N-acetylmuramoyl-L-alanyl-D-glutamate--2,6-diaminopimelate ligase|nr:UDP-N-acetylmuramoyl-L-alanyl-D-glutamate--2,6-diaminopimelate ligase [Solirubrobacteraceae bacterium]
MRLGGLIPAELMSAGGFTADAAAVEIASLAYDSRRVTPDALFFCVVGEHSDGHDHAAQAVRDGAAALVVERPLALGVPEVRVASARAAMGPVAARFYGDPTARLRVVGVTGTNGKTTTAFLVRALMEACGHRCGLLGTVTSIVGGERRPAGRTTPEAIDLQRDFRAMLAGGEEACAMEVSSHALALGRADGVRWAAAIFTNLTQDHLDFHGTMEEYFQAKRRLFVPDAGGWAPGVSVINLDDPYGRRLAAELPQALTFAIERDADYRAHDVRLERGRCILRLSSPAGERALTLPLPGRFNIANALGALAAVHRLGGDLDTLLAALERGVRVPGRMEPVEEGQGYAVVVDYAHTPDSLENVLVTARELTDGRVICVFGAGGDRDRGKRALMGEVAARLADVVVVTSDNPRSEGPQAIVEEIMKGVAGARPPGAAKPLVEVDRRAAIERAIEAAAPGDVVVIAGKGHEQGQEFAGGRVVPFDDVSVAREALRTRHPRAAGAAQAESAPGGAGAPGAMGAAGATGAAA